MRRAHQDVAHLIVEAGGELGFDEPTMSSELCELTRQGRLDGIRLLLESKADPGAADYDM